MKWQLHRSFFIISTLHYERVQSIYNFLNSFETLYILSGHQYSPDFRFESHQLCALKKEITRLNSQAPMPPIHHTPSSSITKTSQCAKTSIASFCAALGFENSELLLLHDRCSSWLIGISMESNMVCTRPRNSAGTRFKKAIITLRSGLFDISDDVTRAT